MQNNWVFTKWTVNIAAPVKICFYTRGTEEDHDISLELLIFYILQFHPF